MKDGYYCDMGSLVSCVTCLILFQRKYICLLTEFCILTSAPKTKCGYLPKGHYLASLTMVNIEKDLTSCPTCESEGRVIKDDVSTTEEFFSMECNI